MNPASQDIKDILEGESSLGLTFATNLYVAKEPAKPDDCVTIFDTPGFPNQVTFNGDEIYQYPSIQIRVRAGGSGAYLTGWELANNIMNQLHGRAQETVNGTLYSLIRSMGEPVPLHWDKNDRIVFIINFNIQRR